MTAVPRRILGWQRWALWALLATSLTGCVLAYRPPKQEEPHAVLKVRRVYPRILGDRLNEVLLINGQRAFTSREVAGNASRPRTAAVLVTPGPQQISVAATFTHQEHQWQTHTTDRKVGNYVYRETYRTRKLVTVTDARCRAGYSLHAQADHAYLVQFTLEGHKLCRIDCYEQAPAAGNRFTQTHCPAFADN
jgi:hypothetical protein